MLQKLTVLLLNECYLRFLRSSMTAAPIQDVSPSCSCMYVEIHDQNCEIEMEMEKTYYDIQNAELMIAAATLFATIS